MLPIVNPRSIFTPPSSSISTFPSLFPSHKPTFIRCHAAADPPAGGPSSSRWWFNFGAAANAAASAASGVGRISQNSDESADKRIGNNIKKTKVNAKERRWSRNRESYLADDRDPLPLPMTYPNTSPCSPEEIDRRLQCDPIFEDFGLHDLLRIARKSSMSGLENVGVAKGQDLSVTITKGEKRPSVNAYLALELVRSSERRINPEVILSPAVPGIKVFNHYNGYVQKITLRTDIEVMVDLDDKPP
ncbi:hypothetical protein RND71_000291 [Anisodus tanguticus]|uniref:Uncharacterized protein n=1 Tax=Anisodus tanguticus TaxID=243964 RepID=A0AAE1VXH3_9SOLA|nr:hypothetical protein RND71_000291 [Anisodus tanguticus]